MRRHLEAAASR